MTIANSGRIFLNGDSYTTNDEVLRLFSLDGEMARDGLEMIKQRIEKIEKIIAPKPKKKRGRKPKSEK